MIKNIIDANENKKCNFEEIKYLKDKFPGCFDASGSFDIEKFKEEIKDKINIEKEGYELKFLGKSYAKLLASMDTTTVIEPDEKHNNKKENKDSKNVYITGDNLDALHHLVKSYAGKIKCIYIDPPYNTGSDGFVYNDEFSFKEEQLVEKLNITDDESKRILDMTSKGSNSHSAWLTFMYPRLLLARDLLSENGIIFISIDDNEQATLKLLADSVFGEANFLTCISRATGTPTGGGFDGLVNELDYILVYAKSIVDTMIYGLSMSEEDGKIYDEIDEEGHRYLTRSLRRTGGEDRREDRPTMYYALKAPDGTLVYPIGPTGYESRWICQLSTEIRLEKDGLIEWKQIERKGEKVWHPYQKYYLENRTKAPGNIWKDIVFASENEDSQLWDDVEGNKKATREIRELFDNVKVFETAKPVGLIEKILNIGSKSGDIIVDFFSGSATTAHAIMKTNAQSGVKRQYILVQLPEAVKPGSEAENAGFKTVDEIGRERIRRAAKKIRAENPNAIVDYGFKHYILRDYSSNANLLDEMEQFNPQQTMVTDKPLIDEFGEKTALITWLVGDGYGFSSEVKMLMLGSYKAYFCGRHIYLLGEEFDNLAMNALIDKYHNIPEFNPTEVVVFGYSFNWTELEMLRTNLKGLKDDNKNLSINVEVRY